MLIEFFKKCMSYYLYSQLSFFCLFFFFVVLALMNMQGIKKNIKYEAYMHIKIK